MNRLSARPGEFRISMARKSQHWRQELMTLRRFHKCVFGHFVCVCVLASALEPTVRCDAVRFAILTLYISACGHVLKLQQLGIMFETSAIRT